MFNSSPESTEEVDYLEKQRIIQEQREKLVNLVLSTLNQSLDCYRLIIELITISSL